MSGMLRQTPLFLCSTIILLSYTPLSIERRKHMKKLVLLWSVIWGKIFQMVHFWYLLVSDSFFIISKITPCVAVSALVSVSWVCCYPHGCGRVNYKGKWEWWGEEEREIPSGHTYSPVSFVEENKTVLWKPICDSGEVKTWDFRQNVSGRLASSLTGME